MKIFEYVFIILGIIFIAYVAIGLRINQGMGAVDNFCQPITWAGNIAVSISAQIDPHTEEITHKSMVHLHYSCEYIGWRLFFEHQYLAWKKQQKALKEAGLNQSIQNQNPQYKTKARYQSTGSYDDDGNVVGAGENVVNQGAPS